jgi:hypothetical protein
MSRKRCDQMVTECLQRTGRWESLMTTTLEIAFIISSTMNQQGWNICNLLGHW